MRVYPEKLAANLKQEIKPIYIVSGDEPLLIQEACDSIRLALRQSGYSERDLFHVDGSFDWQQILYSASSMSLFTEKKMIELRMPGGKPGDKGAKVLKSYSDCSADYYRQAGAIDTEQQVVQGAGFGGRLCASLAHCSESTAGLVE